MNQNSNPVFNTFLILKNFDKVLKSFVILVIYLSAFYLVFVSPFVLVYLLLRSFINPIYLLLLSFVTLLLFKIPFQTFTNLVRDPGDKKFISDNLKHPKRLTSRSRKILSIVFSISLLIVLASYLNPEYQEMIIKFYDFWYQLLGKYIAALLFIPFVLLIVLLLPFTLLLKLSRVDFLPKLLQNLFIVLFYIVYLSIMLYLFSTNLVTIDSIVTDETLSRVGFWLIGFLPLGWFYELIVLLKTEAEQTYLPENKQINV